MVRDTSCGFTAQLHVVAQAASLTQRAEQLAHKLFFNWRHNYKLAS